ncbi:GNAT family N-acetyltransferase [Nocardiopsis halophila]|uniref:GNAT family N-acetyltransferase n=1 Tax=Nocardiopsis halophila TaxID=141692 RepID=UPI0003452384|nr:hypothetical protein [Nocardiopsis halophila]
MGGMVRIDPVYTPSRLRGRGYAGAQEVVLFTDPANPTSNALYQRLGYHRIADFAGYRLR